MTSSRPLQVVFFATEADNEPVRSWLKSLPKAECKTIGVDILKVQFAWPIGKPLVDNLGDGLWAIGLPGRFLELWTRKLSCFTDSSRRRNERPWRNSHWQDGEKINTSAYEK